MFCVKIKPREKLRAKLWLQSTYSFDLILKRYKINIVARQVI